MKRKEIDKKYLSQANNLEVEFFDIVEKGLPNQHRVLKTGKIEAEFNQRHGDIWKAHEAELITSGFMAAPSPPEPVRDLAAELDDLKARIEKMEKKWR